MGNGTALDVQVRLKLPILGVFVFARVLQSVDVRLQPFNRLSTMVVELPVLDFQLHQMRHEGLMPTGHFFREQRRQVPGNFENLQSCTVGGHFLRQGGGVG